MVGILLSGANKDGAKGMLAISKSGGTTIIQDPKTCQAPTMPNAARKLGQIEHVFTIEQIIDYLLKLNIK